MSAHHSLVMIHGRRVQVHQADLTHMDAAAREAANATRTAFGNDYEVRLRSEAGAKPDKMARRKHQISSLYHAAKLKVRFLLLCSGNVIFMVESFYLPPLSLSTNIHVSF